jgi:GGDEF domain-containing protein
LSWFLAQAIVKRKSHHLELFRSANFDHLTGLPNRSLFFERFEQTLKQAHQNEKKVAVLFLDLLLQKADHAMYKAKKEGKNCFRFAINDD